MAIHNTSVAQIQIIRIKNCIKTSAFKRSPSQWINCASIQWMPKTARLFLPKNFKTAVGIV